MPPSTTSLPAGRVSTGHAPRASRDGLPPVQSRAWRTFVHLVALAAVLVTVGYLTWRVLATLPTGLQLLTGVPFLLLELQGALTLVLFVLSTWDVDPPQPPEQTGPPPTVTVLIATYNEHLDVLLPTVAACLAMDGDHETWVLDDGDRIEVEEMVTALGARYVTRPEHGHAKAGNLNHALGLVRTQLVAVFDADHVPERDFLTHTLPWFADPRIALVQTPQDFYNRSSFEHLAPGSELHEESLFYRVVQPGKNRAGAAFWCGTNAVLRLRALEQVGGVATETLTEDFHTTMRLHQAGWRSVFHNQVLARGLAAGGPDAFYAQRRRWGRGAMQVLRVDNPFRLRNGLSWGQRLGYAYSLSAWFDSWRTLGLALVPAAVVVTGLFPVAAPPLTFSLLAGSSFLLQQLANALLGRGFSTLRFSLLFDVVRLPSNLAATLSLVRSGTGTFQVTAKGRTGDARQRATVPRLIWALAAVVTATLVYGGLTFAGLTPTDPTISVATVVPLGWLAVTLAFVIAAVRRIRDPRYATERREGHRYPAGNTARVGGSWARLVDVSLGGAQVRVGGAPIAVGTDVDLAVRLPDRTRPVVLRSTVRWQSGDVHRLEFLGRQWAELAALSITAFGAGLSQREATGNPAVRAFAPLLPGDVVVRMTALPPVPRPVSAATGGARAGQPV